MRRSLKSIIGTVAALLALLACVPAVSAQCLFANGFEDFTACAGVTANGCSVPVPATGASAQIAAARQAADGAADVLIQGALVSYRKPTIGADVAGFFVQASDVGPALFVAVDPTTLVPAPVAGDLVTLRVTQMGTSLGMRQATAIAGWSVSGSGGELECLLQEVSTSTDLVSNLASYESELIALDGTVAGAFGAAGTSFQSAPINTVGISGDTSLRLRVPTTLRDAMGIAQGCSFTLLGTPLWRANTVAQPSAWTVEDLSLQSCPAPTVMSAVATSITTVAIEFSRPIDPGSVLGNGTQFSFDNGLMASAASASGSTVTVTTSAQLAGTTYTVTVASSVTDTLGGAVGIPNTASFGGFQLAALLRINELNANVANGCDQIELRVVSGGSMQGIQVGERNVVIHTFPPFQVQSNDRVVIHFDSADTLNCNPGSATGETTSTTQQPSAIFGRNYDAAFDWHIADTGLTNTDNVITLYAPAGGIMDAVLLSDDPTGIAAADSETQAGVVAGFGQWQMVGGGVPPGGFVDDNFNAHAVLDLNGTDIAVTGASTSIQRNNNTDSNDLQGWAVLPQTFGALNSGQ